MSGVRGKSSTPTIKGPSRPPAGRINSLRTGTQAVSGPAYAPAGSKHSVRGKSGPKPVIKTPVRSGVVKTT